MKGTVYRYKHARVSAAELEKSEKKLKDYRQTLKKAAVDFTYATPETFCALPHDEKIYTAVESIRAKFFTPALKYIFVVGIGAANAGARAVFNAVRGISLGMAGEWPILVSLDASDEASFSNAQRIVDEEIRSPQEFCILYVSKSGTTIETAANFEALYAYAKKKIGPATAHRVIVAAGENSPLVAEARKSDFPVITIPESISGRFSVFSPESLVVLACAGIDVEELLAGAAQALVASLSGILPANNALALAGIYKSWMDQKHPLVYLMTFNKELRGMAHWWRQLIGESLAKPDSSVALAPAVLQASDLHSQMPVLIDGPRIHSMITLRVAREESAALVPKKTSIGGNAFLAGREFSQINEALYGGMLKSLIKAQVPTVEMMLPGTDEYEVGYWMQEQMIAVAFLGQLVNTNPFTQPGVEGYKKEARALLKRK